MHLVSKTHCSAQNLGLGAQMADHWVRRYVRGGSAQKLNWLVVEEITQLDMALWADLACVGLNADVKFLLLGERLPAVAGRAGLLGRAAHQRAVGAQPARPRPGRRAQARAHGEHALRPRHLQLCEVAAGRRGGVQQAKARLRELFLSKPGWPDTTLVISHSKRMAVNAAANRALAPEGSKLLELETHVIHIDLGGCSHATPRSGAGRSEAGPSGAAAGHPAKPRSYLRQLPGPHPPQPRPPGPGVLPSHAAPPVRGRLTGHELLEA